MIFFLGLVVALSALVCVADGENRIDLGLITSAGMICLVLLRIFS